ncbi:transient receptor potential cation channel subfamily M member 1-like [Saccostrea echinata]|uniref:transient receptor potential cation channel subfamily M member 1-like n=1 Tax=Saccostrea echinata TaxID=191078 RepID=UPI002A80DF7C|nr:transient receptor potential cation channel subfamily M member 1-like [Saccostrea echinata]
MDDKGSDWKETSQTNNIQETELEKKEKEDLDSATPNNEEVLSDDSSCGEQNSEHSVHDTITSVLHMPLVGPQQSECSPQSPAHSPRPILTSQQSIVSGRFTRTSYISGDTVNHSSPSRLSPAQLHAVETEEDIIENNEYASSDTTVDDSTEYVESAQITVTSFGAISTDTQDSARYDDAPFPCGNIHFWSEAHHIEEHTTKKHYVTVSADTPSEAVAHFMGTYWKMRSPKIVLSVISGVKHFRPWKNNRLKEQFQKGIIKAANTTEMWIITDGVDTAVSKMIGEAIKEERARRECKQLQLSQLAHFKVQQFQKLTVIGIVPKNVITYSQEFQGNNKEMGINIKNVGIMPNSDLYELNPDHTHFIIVDEEDTERMFFTNIRCQLEQQFQYSVGRRRRLRRLFSWGSDDQHELPEPAIKKMVPVVGLLVQGSPRGVEHVLTYLNDKMPVVILKGSGGVADLLAYAFEELVERTDPDFEEHFLKPELTRMICKIYPEDFKDNDMARTEFRNKILQCCHLAIEDEQIFFTIVNTQGWDANLKDLDKYLLKALFNCERQTRVKWREKIFKDLQLILDWNRPDMALSMIFHRDDWGKVKVDKKLFEQALLKLDREEFVEIFLDQGFLIHKYLNHKKYKLLFEKAEDREFFVSVCLEKVLGQIVDIDQELDANFLVNDLNRLIFKLLGLVDFVQPYEMSMNSVGLYVLDPAVAERKALNWLTVWAVLMNRRKLAKVLWNRCDEPIALALICSNLYKELARNCTELFLRTEMERNAKQFGDKALGVLDIGYMDSSEQTYSMLSTPLKDFNNKTCIEIAHDAGYIGFIAHPCCQKWLTRKLFGAIQVKELDLGFISLPDWFKILASVFFIFPIYVWIGFVPKAIRWKKKRGITFKGDADSRILDDAESESEDEDDENLPTSKSLLQNELETFKKRKKLTVRRRIQHAFQKPVEKELPLWKKIYLLWSAPITTFWVTQTMYFAFLGLFCVAVLWPTCGNFYLDLTLWLWTSIILIDLVQRTYRKHIKHKAVPLLKPCCEIFLIMVFLVLYLVLRIIPHWFNYTDIITSKVVLSIGLIFFFYRLLGIYLPISTTLGPMLVRMNRMIKYDFVDFIRMFLVFMISGGVTIQAILYPNYPLGIDLIKRVLTRPLFAMFLTQIADLDGDVSCSHHYKNVSEGFCTADVNFRGSHYANPEAVIVPIQKCPYSSLFGYLITIQYLLICKLVLVTLLFAMFALTITKVDNEASEIWKFQRYALIVDFEERLNLPPPLVIISYICILVKKIYNKIMGCKRNCSNICCCRKKTKADEEMSHKVQKNRRSEDYNYWKKCSIEFLRTQELKEKKEKMAALHAEIITNLQEDMRLQKKNMKRISDRIVELERTLGTSRMYLENIYHKLDKQDVHGMANRKGQIIHVAARQSPYPGTSIARFPVFDKYVPWETSYDVYDPKIYTLATEKFSDEERIYVDLDIILVKKLKEEYAKMTEEELIGLPPLPSIPNMKWNSILTVVHQTNGGRKQIIDRRSWISMDDQPCRYQLDPNGLPLNPMGRTGIRGKGNLWRWGPNHVIKAVCTRWRQKYNQDNQPSGYLYVEGKRVLEFIATQRDGNNLETVYELPGGVLHGLSSPYSVVCESFLKTVFDENEVESKPTLDQGDMIQFFAQFATLNVNAKTSFSMGNPELSTSQVIAGVTGSRTSSRTSLRTEADSQGFSASLLYKGYLDDPRNTDNAWMEAEVWNFHYDLGDNFELRMSEENGTTWKEVLPNVKLFGNEGAIIQEAARIQDAYC